MCRLCAPDTDKDFDDAEVYPNQIPQNWPDHIDEAIRQLNDCIRPALNATPHELLFGMSFGPERGLPLTSSPTVLHDVQIHSTLADIYRTHAHQLQLMEAEKRKLAFDKQVAPISFPISSLVHYYDSKADQNYRTVIKLKPRWSDPHLINGKYLNSYSLCTLNGIALNAKFHTRRLRHYTPQRGSALEYITPQDNLIPTEKDLDVAEAEERMAEELEGGVLEEIC